MPHTILSCNSILSAPPRKIALLPAVVNYPKSSGWQNVHSQNNAMRLCKDFKSSDITLFGGSVVTWGGLLYTLQKLLLK
jgi:hypothetical protein